MMSFEEHSDEFGQVLFLAVPGFAQADVDHAYKSKKLGKHANVTTAQIIAFLDHVVSHLQIRPIDLLGTDPFRRLRLGTWAEPHTFALGHFFLGLARAYALPSHQTFPICIYHAPQKST